MGRTWTVSTQIEFSASHCLEGYEGACSRVHGHNWTVRAFFEFDSVDDNGITVDFLDLKSGLEKVVLPRFDHVHLNDVPPFDSVSPTSENLAAEIFRLCARELVYPGGRLAGVELGETSTDRVLYSE